MQMNSGEETKATSQERGVIQTQVTPNSKAPKNQKKKICNLEKAEKEPETYSIVTILVKAQALFPKIVKHKFLTFGFLCL